MFIKITTYPEQQQVVINTDCIQSYEGRVTEKGLFTYIRMRNGEEYWMKMQSSDFENQAEIKPKFIYW